MHVNAPNILKDQSDGIWIFGAYLSSPLISYSRMSYLGCLRYWHGGGAYTWYDCFAWSLLW